MPLYSRTGSIKLFDGDMSLFRKLNEAPVYNWQNYEWYWLGPWKTDPNAVPQYQFKHNLEEDFLGDPYAVEEQAYWNVQFLQGSDFPNKFFNHDPDPGETDQDFMYVSTNNSELHREGYRGSTTATGRTATDFFNLNFLDVTPFEGDTTALVDLMYSVGEVAFSSSIDNVEYKLNDNYGIILYRGSKFPEEFVIYPPDPGETDQSILYDKYNFATTWIDHGTYGDPLALIDQSYLITGESEFGVVDNAEYITHGFWDHLPYTPNNMSSEFLLVLPDPGETDQNLLYDKYNFATTWIDHGTYGDPTALQDQSYLVQLDGGMGEFDNTPRNEYGGGESYGYTSANFTSNYYGGWRFDQDYIINSTNVATMFI